MIPLLTPGKLYKCEKYFLMLYPEEESAVGWGRVAWNAAEEWLVQQIAASLTREFGKPVSYIENTMFLVLSVSGDHIEVLAGDKKGWISSSEGCSEVGL